MRKRAASSGPPLLRMAAELDDRFGCRNHGRQQIRAVLDLTIALPQPVIVPKNGRRRRAPRREPRLGFQPIPGTGCAAFISTILGEFPESTAPSASSRVRGACR